MKKVYLKDIAKNLNLSKTTVSLVLNHRGDEIKISQDTQQRIFDYAKKHNYVPNQLARGLSRGKSETIGLIVPDISNSFYAQIAGHIERKAEAQGYTVIFSSSHENPEKEAKLIQSMLNRQVDGLIIASTQQNADDIRALKKADFPFVLIDRHYPNNSTNFVVVDNYNGVKKAAEHLLELGRRNIGFVTVKLPLEAIRQRLLGYTDAIRNHFGPDKNLHIKELNPEAYAMEMKAAISEMVNAPDKVDALIFSTHYLTAKGLRELKKLGIKVPEKVAIISFDELGAFDMVDPPITAIMQPVEEIGTRAVAMLLDEMEGKRQITDKNIRLKTQLKIRKSCGS